ncbi:E3 ubiquitin-protein ligase MARCH11 [Phlyctema vagabunda]|uniref:E3 ubiquitin-protein ligase MARCH11 n=1 Tax=Phlyctema vagabunda TaxID=108571 RepID=A0ABR4PGG6_9HELO
MSSPYVSTWSWKDPEEDISSEATAPTSPPEHVEDGDLPEQEEPPQVAGTENAPRNQKYYGPRTCRICLEVVHPTFEPVVDGGLASMINPAPKVSYISEDAESGRLIRPCKCKGSQRYCHEGCLQAWRHADPSLGRRNFWECPTCKFRYRLERLRWSRWFHSTILQLFLTFTIVFATVFVLGFVADPIINLYLDPYDTITASIPLYEDEPDGWIEHFLKGLASLGLLGFVKVLLAMSPWTWWNLRSNLPGAGARRGAGRGGTGRDRLENISWMLVIIGVVTFLVATWKFVRAWSARILESAGQRVADVQGDDDSDEPEENSTSGQQESRKSQ